MKLVNVSLRLAVLLLSLFLLPLPRMWADIYSGEVMEYVNKEKGLYGETVSKIMADTDGRIWIATNDGVCLYNGMKITAFPIPGSGEGHNYTYDLTIHGGKAIYAATGQGVFRMRPEDNGFIRVLPSIKRAEAVLSAGGVLFVGNRDGLHISRGGQVKTVTVGSTPLGIENGVRDIRQGGDGGIWFISRYALNRYDVKTAKVKSYNLRGFSFREYLNLQTGMKFHSYTLEEILSSHEQIAKGILSKVRPLDHFQDYMHHGFYPFFLEKRNFSENLLKTMNMMVEVDILLIKQIELKYLSKIKKLLYLLAVDGPKAPNVSQLANDIQTSRATVMNYIKYLADARLINMVYPKGEEFPKKPSKIMMHNPNLMYSIYPVKVEEQDILDTFFVNTMWKDHKVNKGDKNISFMVDEVMPFKICSSGMKIKNNPGVTYAMHKAEIGRGNQIPLWLFGFLY